MVRWNSYRDQWLSEAFAEYSAMLFIETTMADKGFFEDILEVYTDEQLGSIKSAMSKFSRPWDAMAVRSEWENLGPIGAGYRASSALIPTGYQIQTYRKGPLVLHMMRSILQGLSKDTDLFRAVMQEFLHTYNGRAATTENLRVLLEKKTGYSWTTFFDQWIYGCDIPTYEWDYKIGKGTDGGMVVTLHVSQKNVPEGFNALVPVRFEFGKTNASQIFVPVNKAENTFEIPVPKKPSKVIFNPNYSVLARVKG